LPSTRQAAQRYVLASIVHHVLVDFVGEGHQVVLLHERQDGLQFRPRKHLTAWVAWTAHQDGLGLRVDYRLQGGQRQRTIAIRHLHKSASNTEQLEQMAMISIKWLE